MGVRRTRRLQHAIVLLAATLALGGCDWSQLGFGPQGTNYNPSEPALTEAAVANLDIDWSFDCACGRPLIVGRSVYVIDASGGTRGLRALDASSGATKWSKPLAKSGGGALLAAVANGLVYLKLKPATGSERLAAYDAATGAPRWIVTPPAPGSGPAQLDRPIVDGQLVFVTSTRSDASEVSAYDTTGTRKWSAVPGGKVFFQESTLATVPGETLYVASTILFTSEPGITLLTGYAVADGTVKTAVPLGFPNSTLPVQSLATANGLVYGTQYTSFGRLGSFGTFAARPETGEILWTGSLFTLAVTPSAVLSDEPRTGSLLAQDPITGGVLWTAQQTDPTAAVANGLVFFTRGDVRRLSDGAVVTALRDVVGEDLFDATPSNGRVYVLSDTALHALAPPAS